jgi:pimeloyl-ACP methyl ester carboxylesterase
VTNRRMTNRWLICGVALVALVAMTASAAVAHPGERRHVTVVLVHGAWADSSSWNDVARTLHDDGYRTVAPDLEMQSVAGDVAALQSTLDAIPGRKILVAHSYGGVVASGASAGRNDIQALVFSAAFLPDEGDSIASLGAGFQPSAAFGHLAFTGAPFASPAYIAPDFFQQYFAQDLTSTRAAKLNAAQHPLNFSIVTTPSGPVGWHQLPSWYAVSGADLMIDPAQERWMAARIGAHIVEYAGASHVGGITRLADRFASLIEQAARATGRSS